MSEVVEVSALALAFLDEVLSEQCVCTIYEPSSEKRYRFNRDKNECSECLGAAIDRRSGPLIAALRTISELPCHSGLYGTGCNCPPCVAAAALKAVP